MRNGFNPIGKSLMIGAQGIWMIAATTAMRSALAKLGWEFLAAYINRQPFTERRIAQRIN
ncbi:MAG: hypothetical protein JWO15_3365 [Sphingomonadales bacterium]|nr:hypothetical protein [Sphingomonadales bacterium]